MHTTTTTMTKINRLNYSSEWNEAIPAPLNRQAPYPVNSTILRPLFKSAPRHTSLYAEDGNDGQPTDLSVALKPVDFEQVQDLAAWIRESRLYCMPGFRFSFRIRIFEKCTWQDKVLLFKAETDEQNKPLLLILLTDLSGTDAQPAITKREEEVLRLVADGLSNKQIADRLYISVHTAINHRKHLLEKFHVKNTAEMIREAAKCNLL